MLFFETCSRIRDTAKKTGVFFKHTSNFFYLTSIELNLFAFLDEEKENYQEIIDRVAKLEKLARLCDENDW